MYLTPNAPQLAQYLVVLYFFVLYCSGNPGKLQHLAHLPMDAPLWVQVGQQDELAEAELKYVGTLARGSTAVLFGVQLKVNIDIRGFVL